VGSEVRQLVRLTAPIYYLSKKDKSNSVTKTDMVYLLHSNGALATARKGKTTEGFGRHVVVLHYKMVAYFSEP
jgi:hypothetical protein